jgi:hypothetical protein
LAQDAGDRQDQGGLIFLSLFAGVSEPQNWPAFDVHLREVVLKGNLTQSSVVSCVGVEDEP